MMPHGCHSSRRMLREEDGEFGDSLGYKKRMSELKKRKTSLSGLPSFLPIFSDYDLHFIVIWSFLLVSILNILFPDILYPEEKVTNANCCRSQRDDVFGGKEHQKQNNEIGGVHGGFPCRNIQVPKSCNPFQQSGTLNC